MNHKHKKYSKVIIFGIFAVVVVLIVALLYIYRSDIPNLLKHNTESASSKISLIQKDTDRNVAIKDLQKLADGSSNKSDKSAYLTAAVDIALNYINDYSTALIVSKELEANDESVNSAAYLAITYDFKKDYENSAKYYGIAAERSPKSANSDERSAYSDYINLEKEEKAKFNEK